VDFLTNKATVNGKEYGINDVIDFDFVDLDYVYDDQNTFRFIKFLTLNAEDFRFYNCFPSLIYVFHNDLNVAE